MGVVILFFCFEHAFCIKKVFVSGVVGEQKKVNNTKNTLTHFKDMDRGGGCLDKATLFYLPYAPVLPPPTKKQNSSHNLGVSPRHIFVDPFKATPPKKKLFFCALP
eukprot:GEMP01127263.1.p1 GENE.GEMP01127263.1~~GEMP01127263.1.p1  ORF type:complete len:106 (-),score=0.23 GEMP01127263.1:31-348(-)